MLTWLKRKIYRHQQIESQKLNLMALGWQPEQVDEAMVMLKRFATYKVMPDHLYITSRLGTLYDLTCLGFEPERLIDDLGEGRLDFISV